MTESDNQIENSNPKPWLWKKGQSGNILGRPKGKTMKEWAKEYLSRMTDEERDEFMEGMPKEAIWKMAEGNPHSTEDSKVEVTLPTPILGNVPTNNINEESTESN
jgi:hypothetical protein